MAKQIPAKTKYRKVQKGRNRGAAKGGDSIAFGDYALQTLERGLITAQQIEALRVAINRRLKRSGKIWIRIFPHKPVTKKPQETRMGKGKGGVEYWAAVAKPGNVIVEIAGVPASVAREACALADRKLPVRCRFIIREEQENYAL